MRLAIATWCRRWRALACAAGADGLIVEVHPNPDKAWSDGEQSLDFAEFDEMMASLETLHCAARSSASVHGPWRQLDGGLGSELSVRAVASARVCCCRFADSHLIHYKQLGRPM